MELTLWVEQRALSDVAGNAGGALYKRVIEAAQSAPGAFRLDGKMIDAPVIAEAVRIVEFYGA